MLFTNGNVDLKIDLLGCISLHPNTPSMATRLCIEATVTVKLHLGLRMLVVGQSIGRSYYD